MWYYKESVFEPSEQDLAELVGFVYVLTEVSTGMKYVGKKLFWSSKTLPITKTRKKKKKVKVESDWRDYFGSNLKIQENVKLFGPEYYHREILRLCKTKGECSYYEAAEQFKREVLLNDDYYNGIINCRINRKHLG